MQWHPIFAHLLRPLVEDHFQVETGMPVGEAPREADLVLLRRTSDQPLPYQGVWRFLTCWNVLEFKGPTVDPRLRNLDLLVELGLGIDRRLNQERTNQKLDLLAESEVSFWYLARHLGKRFLKEARRKLGKVTTATAGVSRCEVLQRLLYLVSIDNVAIEPDSVPMHLLNQETAEASLAVTRVVIQQPGFWERYGAWLAFMHPELLQEIQRMARANGIEPTLDLRELFKVVGFQQVIDQMGADNLIEAVSSNPPIQEKVLKGLLAKVAPDVRKDLFAEFEKKDAASDAGTEEKQPAAEPRPRENGAS